VILDDMVLDLSSFIEVHPGGKTVLMDNIGRDVSKFFYGAYAGRNSYAYQHG
jgi:cytochrome b involved in lipid metabolism